MLGGDGISGSAPSTVAPAGLTPNNANEDDLGSTSLEFRALYLGEDANSGLYLGLNQNARWYYDETTNDHVILAASQEVYFDLAKTMDSASDQNLMIATAGTLGANRTNWYGVHIGQSTVTLAGNTLTNAYNLYVGAAPASGTNKYSLGVAGNVTLGAALSVTGAVDLSSTLTLPSGGDIISAGAVNFKVSGDNDDYLTLSTASDVVNFTATGSSTFKFNQAIEMAADLTMASGGSIISAGAINFKTSGDTDDYLTISTASDVVTLTATGSTFNMASATRISGDLNVWHATGAAGDYTTVSHDATDGRIVTGSGTLNLVPAGQGIEIWHTSEAAGDYVNIYHNATNGYIVTDSGSMHLRSNTGSVYLSGNSLGVIGCSANPYVEAVNSTTWAGSVHLKAGNASTAGSEVRGVAFFTGYNTTDNSRFGAAMVCPSVDTSVRTYAAAFANQADPTLAGFSHEDPDTTTVCHWYLRHDGTNAAPGNAHFGTGQGNLVMDNLVAFSTTASITASTTQSQGQQALTSTVNEISTCANANDVVTLPTAAAGVACLVINNGAQTLQVFPASGDDLGAGVDTSTTIVAGSRKLFWAFDGTNWEPAI